MGPISEEKEEALVEKTAFDKKIVRSRLFNLQLLFPTLDSLNVAKPPAVRIGSIKKLVGPRLIHLSIF